MRICLISREYPPDTGWGGIGAYTYQIAQGLKEIGEEVEVVSLAAEAKGGGDPSGRKADIETSVVEGVTIHRAKWANMLSEFNMLLTSAPHAHYTLKTSLALWQAFLWANNNKPFDVVEVPEHLAGGFFNTVSKAVPTVVKLHTPHSKFTAEKFHDFSPNFDNQLINLLERIAIVSADLVCSPSKDMAKFVSDDTGYPVENIEIVPNPVNTAQFTPDGPQAFEADGKIRVMFAGRLEERKGIPYLVEAIPEIAKDFPASKVKFFIIGKDTNTADGGTSMLEHLKNQLKASGCLDSVDFISYAPLAEMPNYYRSADICVIPSLYDNAPYTCIEALSSGKPVIASTAGGTQEYVQVGKTGLLVPPKDSQAIAGALRTLLRDAQLRQSAGEAARSYVLSELDRKRIASRMVDLYKTAQTRFQSKIGKSPALYLKPSDQLLPDALELIAAYEKMIYDVMYQESYLFRVGHWQRLIQKRPKLFAAKALLSAAKPVVKLATGKDPNRSQFIAGLKSKVQTKETAGP